MCKMQKSNLKLIFGFIALYGLAIFMLVSSFNGILFEPFVFSSRSSTYCFTGVNRIVFSLSLLFWGLVFFALSSFGVLYKVGLVKQRKPGSLPDKYVLPPMAVAIVGLIIPLIIAGSSCG